MIESPCPHNICVNTPPLDSRHGTIACLPNDVIITIENNEDDTD